MWTGSSFEPHRIGRWKRLRRRLLDTGLVACLFAVVNPAFGQSVEPRRASAKEVEPAGDLTTPPGVSPHVLQTWIASGLTLGLGTAWYLVDDRNVLDWDRPSLKSRLTGSSWRYDNNGFGMNFFLHPLFGAQTYAFARASHWSVAPSFFASFLTSMTWEFVIEYNERVSINDVIVTPVAGVGIGEFAHKLGYYLGSPTHASSTRDGGLTGGRDTGRVALRYALSPTSTLAAWSCAGEPRRDFPQDNLGYRSGLYHQFALQYGVAQFETNRGEKGWVQSARTYGKLVSLPRYRQPGLRARAFTNAEFSELTLDIDVSEKAAGVRLLTDTTLVGYAARQLSDSGSGFEHMVGLGVGFEYRNSSAQGVDDRLSFVGFPGVTTELYWARGELASELSLRLYPVFGGSSSPAFQPYRNQHPDQAFKTILEQEGYFYGWGGIGTLEAKNRVGRFRNQFLLRAESIRSSQGLDRNQDEVTNDSIARESSLAVEARTWFDLGNSMAIGVSGRSRLRRSRFASADLLIAERSLGLWIGSQF